MIPNITISERAKDNLSALLARRPEAANRLRIYVINPGTSLAHCGISYAGNDAPEPGDERLSFGNFDLLYKTHEAPFLDGTRVDYQRTSTGEKLALTAPKIKAVQALQADAPLAHRVTYVLETEVNPTLSTHDGAVMLHQIREDRVAVLKFGGSCHGCGRAEDTLRNFVAKLLKERFPELADVVDDTDHASAPQPQSP